MQFTIDRFEGEYAVIELENREMIHIPCKALPEQAKEGDVIIISIDKEETECRKKRIEDKFKDLLG